MTALIAAAVVVGVIIFWLIFTYNRFVSKQARIDQVWDEVDTHLKLRHELIPTLLAAAAGHMGEEAEIFGRIEELNAAVTEDLDDIDAAPIEDELSTLLRKLRDDASKMPELMLDQNFITTLGELVSMEGRAMSACKRHNDLVRKYNQEIEKFPANILVKSLHFYPCEMRIFGA